MAFLPCSDGKIKVCIGSCLAKQKNLYYLLLCVLLLITNSTSKVITGAGVTGTTTITTATDTGGNSATGTRTIPTEAARAGTATEFYQCRILLLSGEIFPL